MTPIGQLLKYLTLLNPQTSSVRLTFYNYLNHFYRAEQPITAEALNTFIGYALEYPHWQQNKLSFGKELQQLLESFLSQFSSPPHINLSDVLWPHELQVIDVESPLDFSETIYNLMNIQYTKGEKFRLISDGQKRIHAVILFPEGQVRVRTFDRKMTIRKGLLEPLKMDLSLAYDSKLTLSEAIPHKVELGPYTCAQFEVVDGQIIGSAVRGYLFQKFQDFRGGPIDEYSKLFFSIKRQEQFFIDRQTDGYYQGLADSMERTANLIKMGHSDGLIKAPSLMAHVEAAIEQVFIGDKLLTLLLKDLQSLCHSHKNQTQASV